MRKLTRKKTRWILRWSGKGMPTRELAEAQGVSQRRIQQMIKERNDTGHIRFRLPGRPRKPIPLEDIQLILREHKRNSGAVILEKRIRGKYHKHIPHNTIHMVLKHSGYARDEPKKQKRRKWVRYEREHSLSLLHTDWHESKLIPGKQVIAYLDDASRYILACDEWDNANTSNALKTLDTAMKLAMPYGGIKAILTDHGAQFVVNNQNKQGTSKSGFRAFLEEHGIKHIVGRINHPQTNGKIERWFQTYNKKRGMFKSLDEFVEWYNTDRLHMSLKMHYAETPCEAFRRKMEPGIYLGWVKGWFE